MTNPFLKTAGMKVPTTEPTMVPMPPKRLVPPMTTADMAARLSRVCAPTEAIKRYHAYNLLGILALNEDRDPVRATALWKESLELARETGDALRIGVSLCSLGYAAVLQGDNERATARCEETLTFAREHEDAGEEVVPETLVNLGLAALGQGE
jgi:ATP/maltotriose-dependent transcriptional regulator MalT